MNTLTLRYVAEMMHAEFSGKDAVIKGIRADSRKVTAGDLFIALPGSRVDGHSFIKEVEEKGAVGIVVTKKIDTHLPTIIVKDTLEALGMLSKAYRKQFQIPMFALTGSCGKTTVKEMLASILSLQGPILATEGNLNTEVGVPLTLLRLLPEHHAAVIEMGARKKGDIDYLMSLASPNACMITNAGVAHLEIFGSERGIAEAKGEIFEYLTPTGTAVINQDDPHAAYWISLLKKGQKVIRFGIEQPADITASHLILGSKSSTFDIKTDIGTCSITLMAPGYHSVQNAISAAAAARALGLSLEDIKAGLEQFSSVSGRLQFKTGYKNITIIDDTYNANPISMRAALSVLAKAQGKKIFVMGDMFELGPEEQFLHRQMGAEAKQLGIHQLFGTGKLTLNAVEEFGEGAMHFADKASLILALKEELNADTTVLVKGSRGMRMEDIVIALTTDCQELSSC